MLTARVLSSHHLVETIKEGAYSYLPKHEMIDIYSYLAEVITDYETVKSEPENWFEKLSRYVSEKIGSGWKNEHKLEIILRN